MEPKSKELYMQIHELYRRFIYYAEKFYDSDCKNYSAVKEARKLTVDLRHMAKAWRFASLEEKGDPKWAIRKHWR